MIFYGAVAIWSGHNNLLPILTEFQGYSIMTDDYVASWHLWANVTVKDLKFSIQNHNPYGRRIWYRCRSYILKSRIVCTTQVKMLYKFVFRLIEFGRIILANFMKENRSCYNCRHNNYLLELLVTWIKASLSWKHLQLETNNLCKSLSILRIGYMYFLKDHWES